MAPLSPEVCILDSFCYRVFDCTCREAWCWAGMFYMYSSLPGVLQRDTGNMTL